MAPRRSSNGFFEQFLDESLQRLSRELERQIAAGIGEVLQAGGKGGDPFFPQRDCYGGRGDGGMINLVVHNNMPVGVSARESFDASGRKQLELTIDQMVANALTRGRQTSGVLGSLFGVLPGLAGR
jgi:hypothetical protein